MDRLAFECEVKLAGDGADPAEGTIEGYASVFGLLDRGGDIVQPGAFKKSLADWRRKKSFPPILWQHDSSAPIGVWTELTEDDKGLKAVGRLVLDVPQAASARALIKAGAVKGLSIGYRTKQAELDRTTGARLLKEVELWEISAVTFPMLPEATLTGAKAALDPNALEQALRAEGLSNREAKLAVSVVRKQLLRDGGETEDAADRDGRDVLMAIRKATAAFAA